MKMPETARYTALVEGNHKKAAVTIWPRSLKRTLLLMNQVPSNQKLQKRAYERYELYILISHTDGKEKLHHSSLLILLFFLLFLSLFFLFQWWRSVSKIAHSS
jgi:hypothetical protein